MPIPDGLRQYLRLWLEHGFRDANGNRKHRITPYSFRYAYTSHMKKKVDPETLQSLMGHKSVTTTMKFYTAASEEELGETAAVAPVPG